MPTFFRKIRKQLAAENRFMKYTRYAIGEIVLVVIGILIALQINNANQERKDNAALRGYLNSIRLNVESDLKKSDFILNDRRNIHRRSEYIDNNLFWRIRSLDPYTTSDINYISQTVHEIIDLNYLNPNLSGFESLKNSGFLSKLQGKDLEQILNQYYNLINEIVIGEKDYNQSILNAYAQFNAINYNGVTYMYNPDYNTNWEEDYEDYRLQLREILEDPNFEFILGSPYYLIIKYENLQIIGHILNEMIMDERTYFTEKNKFQLAKLFDRFSSYGYPKLVSEGAITGLYDFAGATSNPEEWLIADFEEDEIAIRFPALAWGSLFLFNGTGMIEQLRLKDFSIYTKLKLELRGAQGGEVVFIGLKDVSNPTDGSETKVELTLTNEYKTYEIPLSSFKPTDISKLFMPFSIIFEKEPAEMFIRSIEYVR